MLGEDVLYLPVRELGKRIRSGALSPVELAESCLVRSERIGPRLNAYATLTPELALKQARAAEREIAAGCYRGPLHGIPYAAKDLLAVKGYPTTWGARPLAQQQFDYDATVIERLERAGAVLIGRAAMIELAGGMGYRFAATPLETNLETELSFPDPLGGIGNLCGLPAISVPCGFSETQLPVGLQFVGRARNDRAVIAAAHRLQQLTDWHTKRPPIR